MTIIEFLIGLGVSFLVYIGGALLGMGIILLVCRKRNKNV